MRLLKWPAVAALLSASAYLAPAQTNATLSFTPIAAEYSTSFDRIVMVSASPNLLRLYNPVTNSDSATVSLSAAPLAVSVSPDGRFAAVGHSNLISFVNLNNAAVEKTFTVPFNVTSLVLSADYVYILPAMSIRLSDGAVTGALSAGATPLPGRLAPDGTAIYNDGFRWPVQNGTIGAGQALRGRLGFDCTRDLAGVAFLEGRAYSACGEASTIATQTYATSLQSLNRADYRMLASHSARGLAAITANVIESDTSAADSSQVHFYSNSFPPQYLGRYHLPRFTQGGQTRGRAGRWLFFNAAGDSLYVINEGATDVALLTLTLPAAPSCAVTLSRNEAVINTFGVGPIAPITANAFTVPASGGYVLLPAESSGNCVFAASSNSGWITPRTPVGGGPLVGSTAFQVRANTGSASRSTNITIGSLTLTVTQPAPSGVESALSFRIQQAEYSASLNRFVLTSAYPNELHIYDPATRTDTVQPLPFVPERLAISPDGVLAGVGGAGMAMFLYIDGRLAPQTPAYATGLTGPLHMVSSNGFGYFAARGIPAINILNGAISTGADTTEFSLAPRFATKLLASLYRFAYFAMLPAGVAKIDFANPGAPYLVGQPGGAGGSSIQPCADLWPAEDGARVFDCQGNALRTSTTLQTDLTLDGTLAWPAGAGAAQWIAHSAQTATIAGVRRSTPTPSLYLFGNDDLGVLGTEPLPSQPVFVTWNSVADRIYAALQLTSEFGGDENFPGGIHTIAAGTACATPGVDNVSFASSGGAGQLAISAGCAWKATSSAGWLTIVSGGFGVGSAPLRYSVARNDSGSARTAAISFGQRSVSITQTAGGTISLPVTSANFTAAGGTGTVTVNATPSTTAWTAVSNAPWVRIDSGAAGTGNGTVGYTVLVNAGAQAARSATINIGGVLFTVNQASPGGAVQLNPASISIGGGGAEEFQVTVTTAGGWLAVSNDSWIRIVSPTGGAGTGNGRLVLAIDALFGTGREGSVTINGVRLPVIQSLGNFRLSPAVANVGFGAGPGTITVEAQPATAAWQAITNDPWIRVVNPGAGTGNGGFSFTVDANPVATARTGYIGLYDATRVATGYVVKVVQAAAPPPPLATSGLHFVPVTPCRIADTREASRPAGYGTPALAAGAPRTFGVPGSGCGVPANAKAYSLNVTVVPKGPLGYITIWPAGQAQPFVSTLNSVDGRVKANAAIVPAGAGGAVSVVATDATELVLDINGYFVDPGVSAAGLAFYPVTACRIADTRTANGALGGPAVEAGGTRSFAVQAANCGIPALAQAYSMNATVVPDGPLGYLTMWPTGQPQPLASTLNAPTGAVVANAALVPAGTNGEVSVFAQGKTHVVLDINGYFAPPGLPNGQRFFPLQPCRVLDTRETATGPVLAAGETRSHAVTTTANCGLPADARAYSLNATVVPTTVLGYLTLWATGQPQPFVSTLNATDDKIVANAAIVAVGTGGAVSSFTTHQTHLILDTNGYFAP